jgi:hypothetical protein
MSSAPAAVEELQGSIPAVGDGDDLMVWLPASELQEHLPSPLGDLLVAFAALLAVTFGGSQGRKERQGPYPTGPRNLRQKRQAHPSEGTRFDQVGAAGTRRVAVDPLG